MFAKILSGWTTNTTYLYCHIAMNFSFVSYFFFVETQNESKKKSKHFEICKSMHHNCLFLLIFHFVCRFYWFLSAISHVIVVKCFFFTQQHANDNNLVRFVYAMLFSLIIFFTLRASYQLCKFKSYCCSSKHFCFSVSVSVCVYVFSFASFSCVFASSCSNTILPKII